MIDAYLGMPPVSNAMVRQIVGRCHVSESILQVTRYVVSRMDGERKGFLKMPKNHRRYAIAAAIQHHKENRSEYLQIMRLSAERFTPRYFFDASTKAVLIAPDKVPADLEYLLPYNV